MAQYGVDNFMYELTVKDGSAHFSFWDPQDANNTAEVSVGSKDFPEGIKDADSRQVADLAYGQCNKVLNDKRDARFKKEAAGAFEKQQAEDKRNREAANEIALNSRDGAVAPVHEEKDGDGNVTSRVYNTAEPDAGETPEPAESDDKKKK